jgi:hypothetical protein
MTTMTTSITTKQLETIRRAATALDLYMMTRAEAEGVAYDLSPQFFAKVYAAGIRTFFGVTVDDGGALVSDTQEPCEGFLAEMNEIIATETSRSRTRSTSRDSQ